MAEKQSDVPIGKRIKDSIRDLADRIVEAIDSVLHPEPEPVPIPVRNGGYRRR